MFTRDREWYTSVSCYVASLYIPAIPEWGTHRGGLVCLYCPSLWFNLGNGIGICCWAHIISPVRYVIYVVTKLSLSHFCGWSWVRWKHSLSLLLTFVLVCIVWSCMPCTSQHVRRGRIGIRNFAAFFFWCCSVIVDHVMWSADMDCHMDRCQHVMLWYLKGCVRQIQIQ